MQGGQSDEIGDELAVLERELAAKLAHLGLIGDGFIQDPGSSTTATASRTMRTSGSWQLRLRNPLAKPPRSAGPACICP